MRVKTPVEVLQNLTYVSNRVAGIMDTIDYITADRYSDDLKASNIALLVDAKLLLVSFLRENAQTISAVAHATHKAITDPEVVPPAEEEEE